MPSLHKGVRGVATSVRHEGGKIIVRYHYTDVVTIHKDGRVTLDTGGWFTATTKVRMNQASFQFGLNYYVHQEKGKWFVSTDWANDRDERVPFKGNKVIIRKPAAVVAA